MTPNRKIKLSLWASGSGTNVENFINYFDNSDLVEISCVIVSNPNAKVIEKSIRYGIPYHVITVQHLKDLNYIIPIMHDASVDYIVLAGFLWKIPEYLIQAYPDKIFNIHPGLLPKYGGKNMYGERVHKAVLENQEEVTGITIHHVNEEYDEGPIIFQKSIPISSEDNLATVQKKVHELEYKWYPITVENFIKNNGSQS